MPFCTQCGHQNPEDSRFCSNCGAPLRGGAERAATDTSSTTISFGVPETGEDVADLNAADQAAVEALPTGSALLIVRRGPNSEAASCSTAISRRRGVIRRATSSSTM